MKLDDNGAAFFVEDVEEEEWSPHLATSPIPSTGSWEWNKNASPAPLEVQNPLKIQLTEVNEEEEKEEDGRKGKLNKKKRRRRNQLRHGRRGSKGSIKDMVLESDQDMFLMDDVNDADQEDDLDSNNADDRTDREDWIEEKWSGQSKSLVQPSPWGQKNKLPRNLNLDFANCFSMENTSTPNTLTPVDGLDRDPLALNPLGHSAPQTSNLLHPSESSNTLLGEELTIENSLIGSRVPLVPKSSSEAEALEALWSCADPGSGSREEFRRPKSVTADFHYFSDTELDEHISRRSCSPVTSDSEIERNGREEQTSWRWGELPSPHQNVVSQAVEDEDKKRKVEVEEKDRSLLGWFRTNTVTVKEEKQEQGMYLDDLISGQVDPQTAAIYLSPVPVPVHTDNVEKNLNVQSSVQSEEESILPDLNPSSILDTLESVVEARDEDCESGHGPSLPMSPQSGIITKPRVRNFNSDSEDDFPIILSRHFPDFSISLCGGLGSKGEISPEVFREKIVTLEDFTARLREDRNFLNHPDLTVRINEKYTTWNNAAPLLLSLILYKEPLPSDLVAEMLKEGLKVNLSLDAKEMEVKKADGGRERKTSSWLNWFSSVNTAEAQGKDVLVEKVVKVEIDTTETEINSEPVMNEDEKTDEPADLENSSTDGENERRCRKTLRLNSERLKQLNLRPGSNEVQFSVTTAFQGTTRCKCHIYLWKHTDKVVISDIDGTITKSDVLGHILPVIGRDWAQSGVAQLFTKIRANGYHIMYLSARAIGQASITKEYLQSVKQGDLCLPDGPLFLNPESLIHAFRKEVIDRNPEEFKIRCLKDIQSLFQGRNPFFAGYGNRPNDAYAYRAVGIPISRIFTINPRGELRHELTQNFQTSYVHQSEIADHYFPPTGKDGFHPDFKIQEYSGFGFWREPIPAVETPVLEDHEEKK
ncbi:phosphatidate phosphatase LPIN2 isoform X1 [Eurytemora carolleeae]|uniref:phosphatidate phosphatase LPIN2 isoform X1 n=1 Tax=Eurytemora carolleeae TaxID=1294199 RepID=UPI000C75D4E9|nr:phosphatidate phosphatase LPIN2 isoform X1 [Eurytemora carolleeae]|eukprot:XP_023336375.1 phosphatidate phosphatase LPIN2-like isoform X1 [Eurytemora affinis]